MTVSDLILQLSAQPHDATVKIVGEVVCAHEDHVEPSYVTVPVEMEVVHVRSVHPRMVQVEVRE